MDPRKEISDIALARKEAELFSDGMIRLLEITEKAKEAIRDSAEAMNRLDELHFNKHK